MNAPYPYKITEREAIAQANRLATQTTHKREGASLRECMAFWGASAATIEELSTSGIIIKVARGRFDLPRSTRLYLDYLRDAAVGRYGPNATSVHKADEVAQTKRAQRQMVELQLEERRGNLVKKTEVDAQFQHNANLGRTLVLGLPCKIRVALSLSIKDEERIEQICDAALAEMAQIEVGGGDVSDR